MRANKLHINSLVAICHRDHETIVIALNIEDYPAIFNDTCVTILIFDILRLVPVRVLYLISLRLQMLLSIQVLLPKCSQAIHGYDSHVPSICPKMGLFNI